PLVCLVLVVIAPMRRFTEGSPGWQRERAGARQSGALTWSVSRAIRTRAFWALFAIYFWTAVAAYSVLPHSVAHLVERGFDPATAAGAFGLTGALSTIGIVGMGVISDRIGRFWTVMVSYVFTMLGIAALWAVAGAGSWMFLGIFVICFGLMQGVRGPVIAALVAILYRGGSVGAIFGALSMALGSGAGVGSYLSGVLHDATGSYEASFAVAIVACLAGLISYAWSTSLKQERLDVTANLEATA
ncbi:MAG: MFS transporter, partial [Pseudomonadota bacterium]